MVLLWLYFQVTIVNPLIGILEKTTCYVYLSYHSSINRYNMH